MHVFRHERRRAEVGALAREVERAAGNGGLELLLAAARLECGLADGWSEAGGEDWSERRRRLMGMSLAAAEGGGAAVVAAMERALRGVKKAGEVWVSEPEGLRYYGLAPEGYAAAARQWRAGQAERRPVWVLGLRTMGSVLAPVVARALAGAGEVRCLTLRPVGEPMERRIQATARLEGAVARWRGEFVIVDEGPGLSGSSFGGTVAWLAGLGVEEGRMVLLASGSPAPEQLGSAYAAAGWRRWRIVVAPGVAAPSSQPGRGQDISGGRWRQALGRGAATPVWGEHERLKYLCDGGRTLAKFAGWGGYGRETRERARRLAAGGWGPELAGEGEAGWVRYRRVPARALPRRPGRAWCEFAGAYLAWVGAEHRLGGAMAPSVALREMVAINGERLLGEELSDEAPIAPPVALDGRMLAVEWGLAERGYVKFDGTDHGDDPFFPGPADIAWDLAAIAVEFGGARGRAVVEAYRRRSGEGAAALAPRLRWHGLAYSLFRAAYCGLAAMRTGGREAAGWAAAGARYRASASRWLGSGGRHR